MSLVCCLFIYFLNVQLIWLFIRKEVVEHALASWKLASVGGISIRQNSRNSMSWLRHLALLWTSLVTPKSARSPVNPRTRKGVWPSGGEGGGREKCIEAEVEAGFLSSEVTGWDEGGGWGGWEEGVGGWSRLACSTVFFLVIF